MAADVIRLRPRELYAVMPGEDGDPGQGEPQGVFYVRTYDGLMSAIAHAQHLSAGGGNQDVLLVAGRDIRPVMRFENGREVSGKTVPPPPELRPASVTVLRPGSPHGKIPELDRTAMARKAGIPPRRNKHCPRPQWPGTDTTTTTTTTTRRETPQ